LLPLLLLLSLLLLPLLLLLRYVRLSWWMVPCKEPHPAWARRRHNAWSLQGATVEPAHATGVSANSEN
jgi:hypothetical protein